MSLFRKMSQVFQQKANAALNKAENPTQALDLSYEKMLENVQQVRRSIADVLTSQKRLEAQKASLQAQYDKLQGQARQALQQGQDDVAKTAVIRAQSISGQIETITPQIEQLRVQEQSLEDTGRKLSSKLELFRSQRDTMKAQYTAAKASTQAMEGMTGLSEQMTDVNLMMDRAKDKITEMQARSAAVTELADSGVLDSTAIGGPSDDIEAALRSGSAGSTVELELEKMKAELGMGSSVDAPTPSQLPQVNPTIVIRIAGEGRYRVPTTIQPALEGLDTAMEIAINSADTDSYSKCAQQLSKLIKTSGEALEDTDLTASDLIVPSADMSLEEAKKLLADDDDTPAQEAN